MDRGSLAMNRGDHLTALVEAICILNVAWDFDAARGLRDDRGGAEYVRESPVPALLDLWSELSGSPNDGTPAAGKSR